MSEKSQSQPTSRVISYSHKWETEAYEEIKCRTSRGWVFTLNNPTEEDCKAIHKLKENKNLEYMCWQAERGEEKGTLHLQGWARTESIKDTTFRNMLGGRAWIAAKRGTAKQCEAYCTKPGAVDGPWRIGKYRDDKEKKGPTSVQTIAEDIMKGKTDNDIASENPTGFMMHYRKIDALRTAIMAKIDVTKKQLCLVVRCKDENEVRQIMEEEMLDLPYLKDNTKYWQGYDDEESVMIHSEPDKGWTRGYPFRIETKGGGRLINCPKRFFIIDADKPATKKKKVTLSEKDHKKILEDLEKTGWKNF